MPLFDFVCPTCEHKFEHLVRGSDKIEEVRCPRCQTQPVNRSFSGYKLSVGGSSSASSVSSSSSCGSRGRFT